jgi:hypothetical protein
VNRVRPWISPSPLPGVAARGGKQEAIQSTLVQHEGRPENIARAVFFLIENDFVTGLLVPRPHLSLSLILSFLTYS